MGQGEVAKVKAEVDHEIKTVQKYVGQGGAKLLAGGPFGQWLTNEAEVASKEPTKTQGDP